MTASSERLSSERLSFERLSIERLASERRNPLAGILPVDRAMVRIAELPFLTKTNVRTGTGLPNTFTRTGDTITLWLGPDEWLVVGAPVPGGVDVSAQYTTIVLSGPGVRDVLAHGCSLDLERLGPDWCAQTMLAKANVILVGIGPDEIHIHVRVSFARYLAAWLIDAATA